MISQQSNPGAGGLRQLYRTLWHHAGRDRRLVVLFMALLVAAQLLKLAVPYLSGDAVNAVQGGGQVGIATAGWDMVLIFAACVGAWVLHGPGRVIERFVAIRIRERFADALYARTIGLPMRWHEGHHSGDTIQRVGKATGALFGFSQHQFVYLQNLVSLVGPIAALFFISPATGTVAILGYLAIAAILVRFDAGMMRLSHVENQAEARYNAALVDCLGNFATVLTLRLQSATRHAIGARLAEVFRPMRQNVVLNETKWCVIDLLNNAICSGLAVLYAWLTYRRGGTLPLGSAVMVYQYAQQIGGVVGSMAGNYQELVRYQADIGSADEIMATEGLSARVGQSLPGSWQEIRIEGLNFAHSGRDRAAGLVDAALTLRRGRKIALVGESGAGKSTLLRLLAGLYEADRITIAVDGRVHPDLRDFSAAATLIPQDPEIFEGSILRNITLGTDCAMSEVRDACDLAGFSAVLDALPEGLETNISERGFNLSGGQKQRLALARGILAARGSSLVMLDEPTSSLDGATEARIYGNLSKAFPDACVVSSIHRLHLLPRFDAVVLMADGQIVDTGSVSELLARQPSFEALWQKYASASHPDAANSDDSIAA